MTIHCATVIMSSIAGSILLGTGTALHAGGHSPGSSSNRIAPDRVELMQAGYARIAHDLALDPGKQTVLMALPRDDMNLFLGSVLLRGSVLENPSLAFAGPNPVTHDYVTLNPDGLEDIEGLLTSLRGHEIRIESTAVSGVIIGVDVDARCDGNTCTKLMLRQSDGSIASFPIADNLDLSFPDPETEALISDTVDIMQTRMDDHHRDVALSVDAGSRGGPAELTFLQANDPWDASYRMTLDADRDPIFQAWAVVRNTSGIAWDDVDLTLSTGPVDVIEGHLFESPEASPPRSQARGTETFAASTLASDAMAESASMPAAEIREQVDRATGDITSRYTLAERVSLDPGEMKMVPLLQEEAPDARYSRYRAGGQTRRDGVHPDRVIRITNSLDVRLPEGIVSLSGESYMGDAKVPPLVPGEDHLARFGEDDFLRIHEHVSDSMARREIELAEGLVMMRETHERRSRYRITPEGEERDSRVLIKHPYHDDRWTIRSLDGAEKSRVESDGRMYWELTHHYEGGEPHDVVVHEDRVTRSRIRLGEKPVEEVLSWISDAPGEQLVDALDPYIVKLQEISGVRNRRDRAVSERDQAIDDQERQLSLMDGFSENSAGFEQASERTMELESRIQGRQDLIDELDGAIDRLEAEARDILMEIEFTAVLD